MNLNNQNSVYEFSHKQNKAIEIAGRSIQIWGVVALSIGIISALIGTGVVAVSPDLTSTNSVAQLSVLLPLALAHLVMGKSYLSSGNALLGVVDTIVELSPAGLRRYGGNWALYAAQRAQERAAAQASLNNARDLSSI